MRKIIEIKDGIARHPLYRMKNPVNITFSEKEQIAIIGENASGKSLLIDIITEKHPLLLNHVKFDFSTSVSQMVSDNVKYITFRDSYGTNDSYYQLRWNHHEEDNSPIVGDVLEEVFEISEKAAQLNHKLTSEELKIISEERKKLRHRLIEMFNLKPLLDKRTSLLSSGELRKLQITKALLSNPKVLIIDNPFIGLDVTARQQFKDLLSTLASETELMVILVLSKIDDIPDFITHVVCVEDKTVGNKISLDEYKQNCRIEYSNILTEEKRNAILNLPYSDSAFEATQYSSMKKVIEFKDVTIKYGNRTILNKLNLSVNCGDRVALSGENGAGKSTLLSIVCADNLQAYANKIVLFDRIRGTGESIWEIKKHIGYISPEMHRSYMKDIASIEIVASGLSDSIGLYYKPKATQIGQCEFWMNIFGIEHLRDRTFLTLSSGEQRLVLLARAFVKDPSLLILDEPMHGLDMKNRQLVKEIIETFCRRKGKTLITVSHYEDELPDCITNKVYLKRNI